MLVRVRRWDSSEWAPGWIKREAGGDALLVDGGVPLVLNDGYCGEDGVAEGGFDETDEGQVSSSRKCRLVKERVKEEPTRGKARPYRRYAFAASSTIGEPRLDAVPSWMMPSLST